MKGQPTEVTLLQATITQSTDQSLQENLLC